LSDQRDLWRKDRAVDSLATRSLDGTFPELRSLLREGLNVLDVGCGPGSITIGVAREVPSGAVTGVDREAASVERARGAAAAQGVRNASFEVQDAMQLRFADATFDLTYSHALFDWLPDPVAALKEQKRVTRSAGIVCAMMTNFGTQMMYPVFPTLQRFFEAWPLWADRAHPAAYHDRFVGRRSLEIFKGAGFRAVELRSMEPRIWHAGKPGEMPRWAQYPDGFLSMPRSTGRDRCREPVDDRAGEAGVGGVEEPPARSLHAGKHPGNREGRTIDRAGTTGLPRTGKKIERPRPGGFRMDP
jgi:SAM-dependent methyltransferase